MRYNSFLRLRKGSSLKFSERPAGDISSLSGDPTAWLERDGITNIPLTVTWVDNTWVMALSDTSTLEKGDYAIFSRYVLQSGEVYVTEATRLILE